MMLEAVSELLRSRRIEGWLVGGSVRDRELGRYSPELDLVVAADAAVVAREIAKILDAPWFTLSERHGACRVMARDGHVDVATLRGESIRDDLAQRDFTVNAMAVPLSGEEIAGPLGANEIVDPFDGLAHLRKKRLVAVSDHIFEDDPLRLMRAARFAHVLGLELDAPLAQAVRAEAPALTRAASERVVTEMVLTLVEGRAAEAVRRWCDLGLLEVVLREVAGEKRLAPALALLERLDDVFERPGDWFPNGGGVLLERLDRPVAGAVARPVALRLAALLHRLSAGEASEAGRRLKLSGEMVELLQAAAGYFRGGCNLPPGPAGRPAVLFLWGASPWEPEVILLAAASIAATMPEADLPALEDALGPAREMMALWAGRATRGVPPLPLDGTALMDELGLSPGPLLGRVLREARLAWEAGEAPTREDVLAVARGALG
jgi:poly(A) polymerase